MGHPEGKARPLKESLESEACPPEGFEGEARTPKKKQKKTKVAAVKATMKGKATPSGTGIPAPKLVALQGDIG